MSARYSISNDELDDIIKFHRYLIDENGVRISEEFIKTIFNKFQLLADFPDMGKTRKEISNTTLFFPELRFNQSIFYKKSANGIHVIRMLGGRQDHLHILK